MLFNSYEFLFLYLPFVVAVYFILRFFKQDLTSKVFLVLASLVFYGWWKLSYLPILIISILVNYFLGRYLIKKSSKPVLILGVCLNLSLLAYFKYADFLIENWNILSNGSSGLLQLMLPLAISFFTFQQIAYLVDTYKSDSKAYSLVDYSLFVTFFPQLIAGPIVHHSEMMPQFTSLKGKSNYIDLAAKGIFIFSIGLAKKVLIADTFAKWANAGFSDTSNLTMLDGWVSSLSYTLQLYFDFSGYTDMAIGAALLFGISLPLNFNSPYKALSIQDFWRRWHITLSRFLRDYIYIPLGGNRSGRMRIYINLMLTFLLGGIWHGAGWTFIFWGALHGLALIIHRLWGKSGFAMPKVVAWFITFNFVNLAWVFFRAESWSDAINVIKAMFGGSFSWTLELKKLQSSDLINNSLLCVLLGILLCVFFKNSNHLSETFKPTKTRVVVVLVALMLSFYMMGGSTSEFLYFNF